MIDKNKSHCHRQLSIWQEAVGVLHDVDDESGIVSFRSYSIQLPTFHHTDVSHLRLHIGERVAILLTDDHHLLVRTAPFDAIPRQITDDSGGYPELEHRLLDVKQPRMLPRVEPSARDDVKRRQKGR